MQVYDHVIRELAGAYMVLIGLFFLILELL